MVKPKPVRKKVPKKNTPRKARNMPANITRARAEFARHNKVLRNQAATDFVVDDQGRSIRYHYERKDRLYDETVSWSAFEKWAFEDNWIDRRTEFWTQLEDRVIANYADKIFRTRLKEMAQLESMVEVYEQYLLPIRDKTTGELTLDDNGLPKFALKLPSLDKFADMYLEVHKRLMLLRGEAITRSEQIGRDKPVTAHIDDPASATPKLSRYETKALARALLHERQKELAVLPETTADIIVEEESPDGELTS